MSAPEQEVGYGQPSAPHVDRAGLVATHVHIAQHVVNLGGKPELIQSLSLEQLRHVSSVLYKNSRKNENSAVGVIAMMFLPAIAVIALFVLAANHYKEPIQPNDRWIILFLSAMMSVPVATTLYDVHRRKRLLVKESERRWAEINIEIALREADLPQPPRKRYLWTIRHLFKPE